jgi:acetylornithine deacetylase/succinyl-diaminopimelate desuccinylase-like protein
MSENLNQALAYFQSHRDAFLEQLIDLLRIPSVSTDPNHKQHINQAAEWLVKRLTQLGFERAQAMPTGLHPIVYAENLKAGPSACTLLIYGHYDVQPAEPLELWETPPYEPAVRGENLYARGASDMKGQVIAALSAIECMTGNPLPVNIKFFLEGEEEIGSPSLGKFLQANKELLKADVVINLDSGMLSPDMPAITTHLRGIAALELRVSGPKRDLHSGLFGGTVHNPAQALIELLAGMHDKNGRVTLPGFYDKVVELKPEEREQLARIPFNELFFQGASGVPKLWGEPEFTAAERTGARPTLEINGIHSGFGGVGTKTVIPSTAMAKITCRLVSDQDPGDVYKQMRAWLEQNAPDTITWELDDLHGGLPFSADMELPALKAFSKALETVWGKAPVYTRQGGSIPVAPAMKVNLGLDSILSGFGLPDDNQHAPNEKQHLPTWYKGIEALIHFFYTV